MALTVKIPVSDVALPEADALSHSFRAMGGNNTMAGGEVIFPFDNPGEDYFSPDAYAMCNAHNWKCEGGMFYHIFTTTEKDNLVPVDWPGSKDSEGERISFEDYFRKDTQYPQADGTWLFRIVRAGMGLPDADRLIYQADLCGEGEQFLVKAEGVALMPTSNEGI